MTEGGCVRSILILAVLATVLAAPVLAQTGPVYKIGKGVTAPQLIKEVKPRYTESAKTRRITGVVEVRAVVLADGNVGDVTVTRSLDDELDREAVNATRQWTFKPGTREGKPVAVEVSIELTFTLK
jgi:protein TonB